jgi:hypothetical protein
VGLNSIIIIIIGFIFQIPSHNETVYKGKSLNLTNVYPNNNKNNNNNNNNKKNNKVKSKPLELFELAGKKSSGSLSDRLTNAKFKDFIGLQQ